MFLTLISWITGIAPALIGLAEKITNLKIAKVNATSEIQKAIIESKIEELHDKRQVLVAEAGSRIAVVLNVGIRTLFALGPLLYLSKYFIWDKVLGSFVGCTEHGVQCPTFTTDALSTNMWTIVLAILSFYFVTSIGELWRK